MIDRKTVMSWLECLAQDDWPRWHSDSEVQEIAKNALELLKEQEPIAPSLCGSKEPDWHGSWRYLCGKCKKPIDNKDRFCKRCGQAVKWG